MRSKAIASAAMEDEGEDDFGRNDDDWLVYQKMVR